MILQGRVGGTYAHTCGPGNPWFNCEPCRQESGYTVSLAGMSARPDDYLPPMNEVIAARDEKAASFGGTHHVTTIGDPR